jgi:prolipoprotein diacylglyceryl transferase
MKVTARIFTDRLIMYIVIGTLVGARLGHFIFYENPSRYLTNPLELFYLREGGLASHGAILGIVLALFLFRYRMQKKFPELIQELSWIHFLDLFAIPGALIGAFIRVGNFCNQEILGIETHMPWAVTFGHPLDGSFPIPRHPVQLYEALWYLFVFFLLFRLSYRRSYFLIEGKLSGLCLILVFAFRFFIEFLKEEQSHLLSQFPITMGQLLSIPFILLGLYLLRKHN